MLPAALFMVWTSPLPNE